MKAASSKTLKASLAAALKNVIDAYRIELAADLKEAAIALVEKNESEYEDRYEMDASEIIEVIEERIDWSAIATKLCDFDSLCDVEDWADRSRADIREWADDHMTTHIQEGLFARKAA